MPLQPLQESLDRTGSQFSRKLQSLVGMAESVKSAQARKQQMVANIEQQKQMIQFRSDVQLEQKKQYYEDVLKPQQEAERQADALTQYAQRLQDSREDAEQKITNFAKYKNQDRFSSLKEYGLDQFKFEPKIVEQNGKVQGYDVNIKYGEEQISEQAFYDMVGEMNNFTDKLKSVEQADQTLTTYEQDGVLHIGNDEEGKQLIHKIRTDEEAKFQYFGANARQRIEVSRKSPEGEVTDDGGSVSQTTLNKTAPRYMNLRENLKDGRKLEFQFAEADIEDDWSIGPIFEDVETPKESVEFDTSIGDVQRQLNKTVQNIVPEYDGFSIGSLSEAEQQMIISGQVNEEQLAQLPEKRAQAVQKMAGYSEQTRSKLGEVFSYYNLYEGVYQEYLKTGELRGRDNYVLDLWNGPQNIEGKENFRKLLKPIDQVESIFKMKSMGQQWARPTSQFTQ